MIKGIKGHPQPLNHLQRPSSFLSASLGGSGSTSLSSGKGTVSPRVLWQEFLSETLWVLFDSRRGKAYIADGREETPFWQERLYARSLALFAIHHHPHIILCFLRKRCTAPHQWISCSARWLVISIRYLARGIYRQPCAQGSAIQHLSIVVFCTHFSAT